VSDVIGNGGLLCLTTLALAAGALVLALGLLGLRMLFYDHEVAWETRSVWPAQLRAWGRRQRRRWQRWRRQTVRWWRQRRPRRRGRRAKNRGWKKLPPALSVLLPLPDDNQARAASARPSRRQKRRQPRVERSKTPGGPPAER
jgi:hypothetical protein